MQSILFSLVIVTLVSLPAVSQQQLKELYTKWLNEEVTYIIMDEEKRLFKQRQTDEERDQFIEQFWLRRDPIPETDKNEFREEHYSRLAYANQHFTIDSIPGWKTDRGYTYITYGEPDEIQKSTQAEIWLYKHAPSSNGKSLFTVPKDIKFEFRNNTLVR